MTRKALVVIIALIYLIVGFLNFLYSLFPFVSPAGAFVMRASPLIGGALAFYAGLTMLRLNELGRRLVSFLLSIRIALNAVALLQLPKDTAGLGIENNFGEIIYRIQSPYAYPAFLLVLSIIALLIILFLTQMKTKEIFVPTVISEAKPDIILEE